MDRAAVRDRHQQLPVERKQGREDGFNTPAHPDHALSQPSKPVLGCQVIAVETNRPLETVDAALAGAHLLGALGAVLGVHLPPSRHQRIKRSNHFRKTKASSAPSLVATKTKRRLAWSWVTVVDTDASGICLRSATIRIVKLVQVPRAPHKRSYGDGPGHGE